MRKGDRLLGDIQRGDVYERTLYRTMSYVRSLYIRTITARLRRLGECGPLQKPYYGRECDVRRALYTARRFSENIWPYIPPRGGGRKNHPDQYQIRRVIQRAKTIATYVGYAYGMDIRRGSHRLRRFPGRQRTPGPHGAGGEARWAGDIELRPYPATVANISEEQKKRAYRNNYISAPQLQNSGIP